MERLQVKVSRHDRRSRFVVLCNGRRVPLHPPANGRICGGRALSRLAAAILPASQHPGPHALVFDIVDTWSGRAIGGCTYHVSHPGGRANEQFPVNAYEAESRRLARFQRYRPHARYRWQVPPEERNPEFPLTLDLRRDRVRVERHVRSGPRSCP